MMWKKVRKLRLNLKYLFALRFKRVEGISQMGV